MQQKRIHTNKAAVQMAFAPVKEFFAPGEFDFARPKEGFARGEMVFARPKTDSASGEMYSALLKTDSASGEMVSARPELCSARPLAGFRPLKMASAETKERDVIRYRSKNKRVACN